MKNKVTLFLSVLSLVLMLFVSCDFGSSSSSSTSGITGTCSSVISGWITDEAAIKTVTPEEGQIPDKYNESDFAQSGDFTEININLSSVSNTTADNYNIEVTDKLIKITNTGTNCNYVFSGTSTVGVKFISSNDFAITLKDASITAKAGSEKQALNLTYDGKTEETTCFSTCFLILSGENTLNGDTSKEANVIKCDGSLVISGEGTLNVNANTKNGIVSDDVIVVNSGTVKVTLNSDSSAGTGIKPVNGFVQNGGTIEIVGKNMTEGSENKGIKVEGVESKDGAGKGYVLINGGKLTITTSGKAITASFDVDDDCKDSDTTNDPYADVFINNGLITITTLATPREDTDTDTVDGVSPEGIEGKRSVTINGGKIVINSTDDGINTSNNNSYIKINGGLIYVLSSQNDAVDSNGTIEITGGTLIAFGSGAPEGGIDCDKNSRFTYTGGTVIALGGSNNTPSASGTTGYYLYSGSSSGMRGFPMGPGGNGGGPGGGQGQGNSSLSSGDTITLLDSSGNVILAFTIPNGADTSNLLIASSSLKKGSTYSLSLSSTVESREYTFSDVLYLGEVEVSIDESDSYTLSSLGTSISL